MTVHVVDFLEAVEVEREHGDIRRHVLRPLGEHGKVLVEGSAVRQVRQRIMQRQMAVALDGRLVRLHVDDIGGGAERQNDDHDGEDETGHDVDGDQLAGDRDGIVRNDGQTGHAGEMREHDRQDEREAGAVLAEARQRPRNAVGGDRAEDGSHDERRHDIGLVPHHMAGNLVSRDADIVHGGDTETDDRTAGLYQRALLGAGSDRETGNARHDGDEKGKKRQLGFVAVQRRRLIAEHGDEMRSPDRRAADETGQKEPVALLQPLRPACPGEQPHRQHGAEHADDRGKDQMREAVFDGDAGNDA